MSKLLSIFSLVLFVGLRGSTVLADVLFVDFNFSDKEIAAAREAASVRGENLVVIPELSDALRHRLRVYEDKVLPLREKIKHVNSQIAAAKERVSAGAADAAEASKRLESERDQLTRKMGNSEAEYEDLRAKSVNYKNFQRDFETALAKMKKSGRTLSAMVVSGHLSDNYFGEAGVLKLTDMAAALKAVPEVSKSLGFVYLWDCYSATVGEVQSWREIFPNINVIGFDSRSTSQRNPYNQSYLKDAMIKERSLASAREIKDIDQIFRSISGLGNPAALAGAACVGNAYYSTNAKATHLITDRTVLCNRARVDELKQRKSEFDRFFAAQAPGFEDVPSDTAGGSVRNFYSLAKQMKGCPEVASITGLTVQAVNLIFFKNLQANFQLKYASELKALERQGGGLKVPNLASTSTRRKEVMQFAAALKDKASKASSFGADSKLIRDLNTKVQALLVNMRCVPSLWIEPTSDAGKLEAPAEACLVQ